MAASVVRAGPLVNHPARGRCGWVRGAVTGRLTYVDDGRGPAGADRDRRRGRDVRRRIHLEPDPVPPAGAAQVPPGRHPRLDPRRDPGAGDTPLDRHGKGPPAGLPVGAHAPAGLTILASGWPVRYRSAWSATKPGARRAKTSVSPPTCGVIRTFGRAHSGRLAGSGSTSMTSSAARKIGRAS